VPVTGACGLIPGFGSDDTHIGLRSRNGPHRPHNPRTIPPRDDRAASYRAPKVEALATLRAGDTSAAAALG
jgi:hypothetical protein